MARLGDVATYINGYAFKPTDWSDEGKPIIRIQDLTGNSYQANRFNGVCTEKYNVYDGDILISWSASLGKPVIVDIEPSFAIKNVSLIKFKADSRVLNIYIRALLQSDYFDDAVLSKVRGGTQKFISLGDIRKLEVLVPPMELQEQFAVFVEQTDKSKLAVQQSIDQLETLKKSLMQKYFG